MEKIIINQLENCQNDEIFFWGASNFLKEFINNNDLTRFKIIGIIDSNKSKAGGIFAGFEIFSINEILNHKAKIIFTIKNNHINAYKSVYNQLKSINLHNLLLSDPFLEFKSIEYATNKIYLVDKTGNKYQISSVPGLFADFKGVNSIIEIEHPMPNFNNTEIIFYGSDNIVKIGSTSRTIDSLKIELFNNNSKVEIGENFSCRGVSLKAWGNGEQITIGKDCTLSWDIQMRTSDTHAIIDKTTKKRINKNGNITVGNHVWIAQGALILKNTNIPNNCVVGARAIVNKKFSEENCVIAGIPAKVVKRNIDWCD